MKLKRFLNEGISLKPGQYIYFNDQNKYFCGAQVVCSMSGLYYLATTSDIDEKPPKPKDVDWTQAVFIDENGKAYGKYPITVFKGNFDEFIEFCEENL